MWRVLLTTSFEYVLNAIEQIRFNDPLESTIVFFVEYLHHADVQLVAEQMMKILKCNRLAAFIQQPVFVFWSSRKHIRFLYRVPSGIHKLEGSMDPFRIIIVRLDCFLDSARCVRMYIFVADRSSPNPATFCKCRLHALSCTPRTNVIIELRNGGKHALGKLSYGIFRDRLVDRDDSHAVLGEECSHHRKIVCVARESVDFVNDYSINAVLFCGAEKKHLLKSRPVRGLGTFTRVLELMYAFPAALDDERVIVTPLHS